MTTIRLYNTASRTKEDFVLLDPSNVRMYVCGPTVYDRAHLGNARPVVVFDVLFRLLRHVYGADHVTYVRNFTDVEDKINARAAETGRPISEITDETIRWYHEDMDALGALRPTQEPRATAHIGQMIAMIGALIERGHAYEADGHVLFAVESYANYGRLSGRTVEDMIAGARVEVAPYKKNPMDFVLWKPSTPDLPGWPSPWGRGRPGWHIECSAMARELLGDSFDIHAGGMDLMFPHHENEIAQSMCAHPEEGFARVWMHNEMLQVEGRKMSKSLGSFFTVRDLLDQGVPGEVIRFVMLGTHYRKPMDWTAEMAVEALDTLTTWAKFARGIPASEVDGAVLAALSDDLNTPEVISHLHRIFKEGEAGRLRASAQLVGLMLDVNESWLGNPEFSDLYAELHAQVDHLIGQLKEARAKRDYETADKIKNTLVRCGVPVRIKGTEVDYDLHLMYVALARDKDATRSDAFFLGRSVFHADWLRSELTKLRESLE